MKNSDLWNYKYGLACEFYLKNGNLLIPEHYIVNDINLGSWITSQRLLKKKKNPTDLDLYRISLLDDIHMIWDVNEYKWNQKYELVKQYYEKTGHLNIPIDYEINGVKLGIWLNRQRQLYLKNQLEREKIEKLERLNIDWSPRLNNLTNMEITSQNKRNIQIKILLKFRNILKYYDDNTTIDLYKQEEITKQMRKKLGI